MHANTVSAKGQPRIEELDGLRAVSVLMVIVFHLGYNGHLPTALASALGGLGPFGVEIFFGISGFIITRLLWDEAQRTGSVCLRTFYVRRFFRILPAYWAYLLAVFGLWAVGGIRFNPAFLWQALGFVSNILSDTRPDRWFIGHTWSLSTEEQYYLALPFFLWVVLRGRRRAMFIGLGILYVITTYADKADRLHIPGNFFFLTEFKYIIAGVLLALAWERVSPLLRKTPLAVPLGLFIFLALRDYFTSQVAVARLVQPVEALGSAFLVGWVIVNPQSCGFLRWRMFQWIGRCSYSLYLWQQIFTAREDLFRHLNLSLMILGLPLLFACAALSYYLIERPSNRLGHRISTSMARRREQPA